MVVAERVEQECQSYNFSIFRNLPLFVNLPEAAVQRFADTAQLRRYKKGTTLYLEGEQADFFYVVVKGWLKLFHMTAEGEEIGLAMLTTDAVVAGNAIFENGCYLSNAEVAEEAEIFSVPMTLLKEQLRADTQLALNMIAALVKCQRQHALRLEQYFLHSAPKRIGCFLLGLCPALEQKDGVVITLPYDKASIASILGMKGATFSRALNILREETGIQISGTRITIESMDRLLHFVDGCYSQDYLYTNLS